MKLKAAIAAAALAASLSAQAHDGPDFSVLSGFVSRHDKGGYNETNYGIGFRIDSGKWAGWVLGTYENSLYRRSFYVGKEWQYHVAGPFHVGAFAGLATGYNYVVVPGVLPEAILRIDVLELAVIAQPLNIKDSPRFLALQVRLRF